MCPKRKNTMNRGFLWKLIFQLSKSYDPNQLFVNFSTSKASTVG